MTDDTQRDFRPQSEPKRLNDLPAHLRRAAPESMFENETLAPATGPVVRTSARVVREPVPGDPDGFFPCPCLCGHGGAVVPPPTVLLNKFATSTAVRDTIRCAGCIGHGGPPNSDGPNRTAATIKVQELHESSARIKDNELAQIETNKLTYEKSLKIWEDGVGKRYRWAKTDDAAVLARVARLQQGVSTGSSLLLVGPFGSGKSWRAYAYARAVIINEIFKPEQVRVGSEKKMLSDISTAGLYGDNSGPDQLRKLLAPGVRMYLIDDVGVQTSYPNRLKRHSLWEALLDRVYSVDDGTALSKDTATTLILTTNKNASPDLVDNKGNVVVNPVTGNPEPGELREWVGEVAFSKIAALMGAPTILSNMTNANTPLGSQRRQVEHERNQRAMTDLAGDHAEPVSDTAGDSAADE